MSTVADHRPGPGTPDSGVKVSGYVLSDGPGTLRPFSTHLTWSLQSEPLRPGDGTRFNDIEFSEDLIEPEFHPLIERAFAAWAQVSGLSVTRLPDGSDANIVIAYTADPNPSQQGTVAAVSGRVCGGAQPDHRAVRKVSSTPYCTRSATRSGPITAMSRT